MEEGYLKIFNNTVVPVTVPRLTQGSLNTVELIWEFPEMWQSFGKRATFSIDGEITYVQIVDNRCIVPRLDKTGRLDIGCYLYEQEDDTYTAICSAHPYTCYVSRGSFDPDIEENIPSAQSYVEAAGEYAQQALDAKNRVEELIRNMPEFVLADVDVRRLRHHYTVPWRINTTTGLSASAVVIPVDNCTDTAYYVKNIPEGISLTVMAITGGGTGYSYTSFDNPIIPNEELDKLILYAEKEAPLTSEELSEIDFFQSVRYYTVSQIDALLAGFQPIQGTAVRRVTQSLTESTAIDKQEVII